jgi:hypothetical protein
MLENFIKFQNYQIKKTKNLKFKILNKISKFQKFLTFSLFFLKIQNFHQQFFMEQSTTILNSASPRSILLYSAP